MSTHALDSHVPRLLRIPKAAGQQLRWLGAGFTLGFLVPYVFADLLGTPRDLYYGIYAVAVVAFFTLWARASGEQVGDLITRRWPVALALGLVCAALLVVIVLRTEDATPRPEGLALVGAITWRGIVYGVADGLLLSAFPILAVFSAFKGTHFRARLIGKVVIGLAAVVASLAMTATYHLGYSDFRSEKVQNPLKGDVIWSAPTLLTLNPIGAPIAHAGLHVSAVVHSYETDLFLPPHH